MVVTRFAPSPTGRLHVGHARAAFEASDAARVAGGRFLVRIEDIDPTRCRRAFEDGILDDLAWLGLSWEEPVRRQSAHLDDYRHALEHLAAADLIYPCFCTRAEIRAEMARAGGAPQGGEASAYPGTCRRIGEAERASRLAAGEDHALRLDVGEALSRVGALTWRDRARGVIAADPARLGDVVLARKETPTSYHLAVTVDDALQGVTLVTRGEDLFESTHVHRLLQALLDLPVPEWKHHALVLGSDGRRLAKRDAAPALADLRAQGATPEDVRRLAGLGA